MSDVLNPASVTRTGQFFFQFTAFSVHSTFHHLCIHTAFVSDSTFASILSFSFLDRCIINRETLNIELFVVYAGTLPQFHAI